MTYVAANTPKIMTLEEYRTRELSQEDNMKLWSASMQSALVLGKDSDYSLDTLMQTETNDSLDALTEALQTFQLSSQQGTDYLGRNVAITTDTIELKAERESLDLHWQSTPNSQVILKVYDESGELVEQQALTTDQNGLGQLNWQGDDGIEAGKYRFEASINGTPLSVNITDKVIGVFPQPDGSFFLELQDLGIINYNDINRIKG